MSDTYSYDYDDRGNMITMPNLSKMDYDGLSQMTHVIAGTTDAYYQYSGGQRIRKWVDKGSVKELRIYLGSYEIYRKFDNSSSLTLERTTVHVADDAGRIAMLEVRKQGSDPAPDSLVRYIYSNHLGSSGLELDESANIISYEEYHPYGTTSYQAMSTYIKAAAKRYRFTGKERDEESGLNYHGARYYIPWLCRWAAVDPLESKYAPHSAYCYLLCNPINDTDSTGKGGDNTGKVPATDATGHQPLTPVPLKPITYTPDGGTIDLPWQVKQLSTFQEGEPAILNGKELNVQSGSLNTFDYHGEIYEARFSPDSGNFSGYYSRNRCFAFFNLWWK